MWIPEFETRVPLPFPVRLSGRPRIVDVHHKS
jgi:hypothetical protein